MQPTAFVNGRFWTLSPGAPDASVLVAAGGRIAALGDAAAAPAGAEVVDLGGRVAIPGPVDAHCHLVSYGMIRHREADLRGAASLEELGRRLRSHAERLRLQPGDARWLLGRGFDQQLLPGERWPTRDDLDAIAPSQPLRITRVCGHAMVANSAALRAAGRDPEAREPGFPTGLVTEERMAAVYAAIPAPSAVEWREAARRACAEAAQAGFVGIHSLMAHEREVRALVELRGEGPLPVRVQMQLPYAMLEAARGTGLRTGFGDDYLNVGAIKLFSDGSLGARTAALFEPYADDPGTSGQLIYSPDELARRVADVYRAGFQVCIHAIGDRAMAVTLDAIAAAGAEAHANGGALPWPPRIEHASVVNPAILRRMVELGVAAAIQPQFARSDCWSPDRLGRGRARGCYAFRTLWEAGIPLAGSTDCPVETLDAMAAIGQLVHRPAWSPDERLPLETALRVFSEGSYALRGFARGSGRLAPGEYADFLVLEHDPRAVAPAEIEHVAPWATVVGGRVTLAKADAEIYNSD